MEYLSLCIQDWAQDASILRSYPQIPKDDPIAASIRVEARGTPLSSIFVQQPLCKDSANESITDIPTSNIERLTQRCTLDSRAPHVISSRWIRSIYNVGTGFYQVMVEMCRPKQVSQMFRWTLNEG
ncbi:hypothetical protein CBOM_05630 [Ceraceosorus bombacis]|uniref:Uncharacterized protein n=1 Tax=Ceraceosorus bombacis TaxID=401625 RepID=A0A0P1BQY0_9BASI|nr:hypothetical protein CBOM_05630 [Ceraceosorus bombacis]